MRMVAVLVSMFASAGALAGPARPCRIALKKSNFDVSCLPALSANRTLIAMAVVDPDGDRGLPNLQVAFIPVDGRPPASTVVLTVDEVAELGAGQVTDTVVDQIQPRLDLVNAQLAVAGFAPLTAIDLPRDGASRIDRAGLQFTVKNGALAVAGRGIATDTVELPRQSSPDCEEANVPFVRGMWAGHGGDFVVRVDYTGSAVCPEPRPAWRVLHVSNAPPAPDKDGSVEASRLNTRAMRKLRARDFDGAATDFRAAIQANPDHVKAHYNLACVSSIVEDRATALAELRWLAASPLPEAGRKIVKARTDPDMAFMRKDPDAQQILAP